MTNPSPAQVGWLVLLLRLPTEPSRYRVGAWRGLRKAGALSVAPGVWAVPDVPAVSERIERALDVARRADGQVIVLRAVGRDTADAERLRATFDAAREEEWREFLSDCGKYRVELDKEIRIEKFTLAELEEEEQSLDRLRRWHRDIASRDVFGSPSSAKAARLLKECVAACEDYAERVYDAQHGRLQRDPGSAEEAPE